MQAKQIKPKSRQKHTRNSVDVFYLVTYFNCSIPNEPTFCKVGSLGLLQNEPTSSKVGAVDLGLLAFGLVFLFAFAWFWLQAPHITSLISERTALRLLFVCCFALDLVSGLLLDLPLLFIIDNTCKMCLWMCEYASVCMSECFVNLYMCDSETGWQADRKFIYSAGEGPLAKAKWTNLIGKQAKSKQN